ncbi:hypothetical protein QF028_002216 [Neobacillus sp. B4I6]
MEQIPAPVQLNFLTELEDILDGLDTERFDKEVEYGGDVLLSGEV